MTRTTSFFAMLGLVALCAACPAREVSKVDPNQQRTEYVDVPVEVNRDIDILFVIDNSISMGGEQLALTTNFPAFMNVLNNIVGGLPNVHIGVVSSDVGVGGNNVGGCAGAGDNGLLQNSPGVNGCPVPMGRYISDVDDGMGGRTRNYSGTLVDNFSCIAKLGTTGCGFEQHFESMKRALDNTNTENAGFLRTDAFLAVIFVADEDDCSASNSLVFDPTQTGLLGPLTSFRCFEFGVTCSPTIDRLAQNPYTDCAPRSDSYLYGSSHYVDFLRSLKPSAPQNIIVAGIIGNPEPVSVSIGPDTFPGLDPSCVTGVPPSESEAFPGIRFKALLDAFPDRSRFTSICNADLTDALIVVADLLAQVIGNPCLQSNIDQTDLFPAPGLQVDCQVSDVVNPNQSSQTETPLPRCAVNDAGTTDTTPDDGIADQTEDDTFDLATTLANGMANGTEPLPCWWMQKDVMECPDTPTGGLVLKVERNNVDPAVGTHVIAKCLVL